MIDVGLALSFAQSLTEQENSALYAVSSCLTYVVAVTFWSLAGKTETACSYCNEGFINRCKLVENENKSVLRQCHALLAFLFTMVSPS